jgi:hypothetical protein
VVVDGGFGCDVDGDVEGCVPGEVTGFGAGWFEAGIDDGVLVEEAAAWGVVDEGKDG